MYAARAAGVSRLFRHRRRARDRGARVRHRHHSGRRQDRRAGQCVRRGGEGARVAPTARSTFMPGPSEIVVVSSAGRPAWIAADLIAQAEHDPDARAILLTPSRRLADAVAREVTARCQPKGPAAHALAAATAAIVRHAHAATKPSISATAWRRSTSSATPIGDRRADRPARARCSSATYSAQASGDYATGSNHVLPTNGAARARGGLSAADFVRVATIQHVTRAGLRPSARPS